MEGTKPAPEGTDETTRGVLFVLMLEIIGRRIILMEKYEAALRNYNMALEKRVKDLEKKAPKNDLDLKR